MKNISFLFVTIILCLFTNSCKFTEKIRDGRTAYERKQYSVAAKMLASEFAKTKSRVEKGEIAYLIGESFTKMNESEKSIEWYKIAYDNQFGVDALKQYALALKKNQQYKEAKQAFKELGLEIGSPYEYRKDIAACEIAMGWLGEEKTTGYTAMPCGFNSPKNEYAPVAFMNNQLIFTSDRGPVPDKTGAYKWTGNAFSDLFVVELPSGNAAQFDPIINSEHNEGTPCFNNDFTEIFFTRCYGKGNDDYYCKLMASKKEGGAWTVPTPLSFVEEKINYGHPTLSKDGKTLYFSANHPDGWGGYDIFYVQRENGEWKTPKVMNRGINTIYDEKFPSIDNDTLYFASSGHTGMGGLDIFKTYLIEEDRWTPVQNLKAPINSGADDFGMIIDYRQSKKEGVLQAGFFCSSRPAGKGGDDLYAFEKRKPVLPPAPEPEPVDTTVTTKPEPPKIVYKMILEGYVVEKIYERKDDPASRVLGRKPLNKAKVQVNFGGERKDIVVQEDGKFTLELDESMDYNFFASKTDYLNNTGFFSTKGIGKDPANPELKFEIEIVLDKIFKDKEIVLDDIYYDFDKWDIREDAQPQLDKLARILKQNPEINIRLASHTDCQGNSSYNQNLSQKRAQSAVNYLISKDINPDRLSAVGYGESALRIDCPCTKCTDQEHQFNRRTTFAIVE